MTVYHLIERLRTADPAAFVLFLPCAIDLYGGYPVPVVYVQACCTPFVFDRQLRLHYAN